MENNIVLWTIIGILAGTNMVTFWALRETISKWDETIEHWKYAHKQWTYCLDQWKDSNSQLEYCLNQWEDSNNRLKILIEWVQAKKKGIKE